MTSAVASKDLVDELVHQFTDPYAFYRELIQNSIDAGSSRIEVALSFRPGRDRGLAIASVTDWGEGMSRRIIEDYLLTKFRSSKENDLTKIGKYGIGFVSIFACAPDAVTLDTGRDGESWRLLFKKDRSHELLKLHEPTEGTRVVLHKHMTGADYTDFAERSREAVTRWCRHSEVDVTFAATDPGGATTGPPRSVREPVRVDAPCQVEHREDGLHVVVGPSRVTPPVTGFYNRGLTLLETNEIFEPGITIKIVSRALEHTLTRDNVRRDDGYHRALDVARKLARGPLLEQLPAELQRSAQRADGQADWRTLFVFAMHQVPAAQQWLRAPGGGALSRSDVARAAARDQALFVSAQATPLTQRLSASGQPVLEADAGEPFAQRLQGLFSARRVLRADEHFTFVEAPQAESPEGFSAALRDALGHAGCHADAVVVSHVRGGCEAAPFVTAEAIGRPLPVAAATVLPKRAALFCLNRGHEAIAKTEPLMRRAPRLAALLVVRMMLARLQKLDEKTDAALTGWALQ